MTANEIHHKVMTSLLAALRGVTTTHMGDTNGAGLADKAEWGLRDQVLGLAGADVIGVSIPHLDTVFISLELTVGILGELDAERAISRADLLATFVGMGLELAVVFVTV